MKVIDVKGSYDNETDMYIAKFSYNVIDSEVKGRTPNTKALKSVIGTVRAIEHAIQYCTVIAGSDFEIHHHCKDINKILQDGYKSSYPEIMHARTFLKPYKRQIKYKGDDTNEE